MVPSALLQREGKFRYKKKEKMATAPRAGRKGGKVDAASSSPELGPSRSPPSEIKRQESDSAGSFVRESSMGLESALLLQFDPAAADVVGKGTVMGGPRTQRLDERASTVAHSDASARLLAAMQQRSSPRRGTADSTAKPTISKA